MKIGKSISRLLIASLMGAASAIAQAPASDHGDTKKLGTVTVLGHALEITRLGELSPGKEGAFQIASADGKGGLSNLNAYLWIEDEAGTQVSAPAKGSPEGDALHVHVTPKAGSVPMRVVVRVREAGKDERGALPLSGHGHEHATPHEGVVAKLKSGGADVGFIELKLHDDKGDLELWLAKDQKIKEPLDLSLDTTVKVEFIDLPGKTAELKVRNKEKNEDEEGTPNVRSGATNYFIFPHSGEDSSWLKGTSFQSIVKVSFSAGGKNYESEELMLVPHTHADGSHH